MGISCKGKDNQATIHRPKKLSNKETSREDARRGNRRNVRGGLEVGGHGIMMDKMREWMEGKSSDRDDCKGKHFGFRLKPDAA